MVISVYCDQLCFQDKKNKKDRMKRGGGRTEISPSEEENLLSNYSK